MRRLLVGGVAAALVLAGVAAVVHRRATATPCGAAVRSLTADQVHPPLLTEAEQRREPDAHRDALTREVAAWRTPFGPVRGAVGFDYGQWIHFAGLADGIGTWTKDDPDFTLLDPTSLRPRWGVRVSTAHSAWDADNAHYLVVTLPRRAGAQAVLLDQPTGRRLWCRQLTQAPVGAGTTPSTLLDDDGLLLAVPRDGGRATGLAMTTSGRMRWRHALAGVGDAASVASLGQGLVLVGGATAAHAFDPRYRASAPGGPAVSAFRSSDGARAWSWSAPARTATQVLGTDAFSGRVTLVSWSASGTGTVTVLDRAGHVLWSRSPAHGAFDPAVFGSRLVVRDAAGLTAYDVGTGRRLWTRPVPATPQTFPYGFQLADQPYAGDDEVLLGLTRSVSVLDLSTGRLRSWPLPTDGVNTTYWPYQLAAVPGALALATNTGALVVGLDADPRFR